MAVALLDSKERQDDLGMLLAAVLDGLDIFDDFVGSVDDVVEFFVKLLLQIEQLLHLLLWRLVLIIIVADLRNNILETFMLSAKIIADVVKVS